MHLEDLTAIIGDDSFRYRVGIFETRDVRPAALELTAARHQLEIFDVVQAVLDAIPSESPYAGIEDRSIRQMLKRCTDRHIPQGIFLWANADIIFSRLNVDQRSELWRYALSGIPRPSSGLIIALPAGNPPLMRLSEIREWEKNSRFARSDNAL